MTESPSAITSCPLIVLRIVGNTILGFENDEEVRNELLTILAQSEATHVILDLREVRFLQSAGFRPLLSLRRVIKEQGPGRIVLCHLSPDVREVLEMTHMISEDPSETCPFHVAPTIAMAVATLYSEN